MKYKALISFTGKISMAMGEIRDISDPPIEKDLVDAGYIKPVEEEKKTTKPTKKVTKT